MWVWEALSREELHERLKAIPADVPPRGQGRKSEHVERYVIRDVLWTLANATALLPYPLSIEKGESPDFDVRANGESIGVEITEAISPNLAHAVAIQTKYYPGRALDASLFAWDVPLLSAEEIHAALQRRGPRGAGWVGDAAEREWANVIAEAVRHKAGKLNGPTFRRQEQNWLAVYDNAPQPVWNLDRACLRLTERLAAIRPDGVSFDRVFIERPIGTGPEAMLMVFESRVYRLTLHRPAS